MDWRPIAATIAGLVLASLADWLFAGVLFHDRYQTHPEVWRINGANPRALIYSQLMTIPTVIGMEILLVWTGSTEMLHALHVALLVWAIAAATSLLLRR